MNIILTVINSYTQFELVILFALFLIASFIYITTNILMRKDSSSIELISFLSLILVPVFGFIGMIIAKLLKIEIDTSAFIPVMITTLPIVVLIAILLTMHSKEIWKQITIIILFILLLTPTILIFQTPVVFALIQISILIIQGLIQILITYKSR